METCFLSHRPVPCRYYRIRVMKNLSNEHMLYNCQDRAIIRYRSQLWKFSLYDNDSRNMSFSRTYDVNVIDRSSKRLVDALPSTKM